MRRGFQTVLVWLILLSISGFTPSPQAGEATIIILNRAGQPVSRITDGDGIQLQFTLPQPVSKPETINFLFTDVIVGSCLVPDGKTTCTTDMLTTLGWYWNAQGSPQTSGIVQAAYENGDVAAQTMIEIKPRPVVLVHGFISTSETWNTYRAPNGFLASLGLSGFAVGDGQVPGTLNTGDMLNPVGRTNTIAQNAEILGQYITGVKQQTGAEMVDLVVHSMGGMISRYYIDRVMQDRDVAQLIMLGSPMGGSDCAVLPAALGFYLPASIEIRESYMTGIFNQQIIHRRGIQFYDLAGTAISEAFKSPCADIPNDTVVSLGSVNTIPLQSSQLVDTHSNLTLSPQAFDSFVRPLLQKSVGTFPAQPDPALPPQTESPLDFTRVYTGHVEYGGSTELTINIEPGLSVASFALYDASRSVETTVTGASGNVIALSPEQNGFVKVDDPASMLYLGYGFATPKPGLWKITVQATEKTPASGTDFAVSVYFIGGARLEVISNTLVPRPDEQVTFTAGLSLNDQPLEIRSAQALIKNSDGEIETLDFAMGQTVSAIWKPKTPGTYAVDVVVTGVAPDGATMERTDFLAIEVQPAPSRERSTFNLVALIVGVIVLLGLLLFGLVRRVGSRSRCS